MDTPKDHYLEILLNSDFIPSYNRLKGKVPSAVLNSRKPRLQLMSWALGGSKKSKLQMQTAILCNLSKAYWHLIHEKRTIERKNLAN